MEEELEKMTHQLRMRSDEALAEKMAETTNQLAAAKAFCAEVRRLHLNSPAMFSPLKDFKKGLKGFKTI